MRARAALVTAALAALAAAACTPPAADSGTGYVSGDGTVTVFEAPLETLALAGADFVGEPVDISDYRGQAVIVTTWYAACPPCRAEAPDLVELDARPDVQVLGVNGRDDAPTAQAFERTFDVQYPSIDDSDGLAIAALQGLVAINAVPTTLVIGPDGGVYARIIGRADPVTLEALVDDALGLGPSAPPAPEEGA